MTTGHRLFCKECLRFDTTPCRHMSLLVHFWHRTRTRPRSCSSRRRRRRSRSSTRSRDIHKHIYICILYIYIYTHIDIHVVHGVYTCIQIYNYPPPAARSPTSGRGGGKGETPEGAFTDFHRFLFVFLLVWAGFHKFLYIFSLRPHNFLFAFVGLPQGGQDSCTGLYCHFNNLRFSNSKWEWTSKCLVCSTHVVICLLQVKFWNVGCWNDC